MVIYSYTGWGTCRREHRTEATQRWTRHPRIGTRTLGSSVCVGVTSTPPACRPPSTPCSSSPRVPSLAPLLRSKLRLPSLLSAPSRGLLLNSLLPTCSKCLSTISLPPCPRTFSARVSAPRPPRSQPLVLAFKARSGPRFSLHSCSAWGHVPRSHLSL